MKAIFLVITLCLFITASCFSGKSNNIETSKQTQQKTNEFKGEKVEKSETEWKSQLNDFEYYVIREKGTERAFSGELWDNKKTGTYKCRACKLPLFSSETKFKSGTGWPSFYKPIKENNVGEITDSSFGMMRTEVVCNRCDGHLGHVFDDGPKPTGLRYCINSVSLIFEEE